jgi:PAS domain S-box-containing protein
MFDAAPAGIACVSSTDGRFLLFNERFRELLGYSREQLARFTLHDITHPDDAKAEATLVRQLLRGDVTSYRVEKRVLERKGKYRDVVVNGSLVRNEHGDPEFFVYVAGELPRAQARSAARESELLLASALERIREFAIIRTDERGLIQAWNAGAAKLFGYDRDEVAGKPRRMLFRDTDNWEEKAAEQLRDAMEAGRIELEDWRVTKNGTHLWVATSLMPVRPDGGTVRGFLEIIAPPARIDARVPELRRTIESLREQLDQRQRTEETLRDALEEMRRGGVETMNELKIMTAALRNEIDRRKAAEANLREALATPPTPIIEEREPAVAPPKRAWKKLDMAMSELLVSQAVAERSGTLVIAEGERQLEVFFDEGRIFSVATNDPSRFLAQRLIELGHITEEQRQRALEIQRETHLALGRILVVSGAIDEERLLNVMRRKAEEEIEAAFTWTDAEFAFVDGEIPTLQLVPLRLDVAALVVQLLESRARLLTDADVPDLEIPLPPPPAPHIPVEALFFASASGKTRKFHLASCISASRINEETRIVFTNAADALAAGYESCRLCLREA